MGKKIFLSFFFLFSLFSSINSVVTPLVPALYVFGDSTVDSGNNNNFNTILKANHLPYGIDFVTPANGRTTNGRTIADNIAQLLGLSFPPPYMGLTDAERSQISTGINYASIGCGILPETMSAKCLTLDDQMENFDNTVKHDLPKAALQLHLSKSIFLISIAANDYFITYFMSNRSTSYSSDAFAEYLVSEFSKCFQRLYMLGARKFLIINIGPLGCLPATAFFQKRPFGVCYQDYNNNVTLYNQKLPTMVKKLEFQLPGSIFTIADSFKVFSEMIANPAKFGIVDATHACCPKDCHEGSVPCSERDKYLFFDGAHTTQVANDMFTSLCTSNRSICSPLSLKELVVI